METHPTAATIPLPLLQLSLLLLGDGECRYRFGFLGFDLRTCV